MINEENNTYDHSNDELSDEERELRLKNQLKKIELTAKYNAEFHEGDSKAPAHIEEQWLDQIEEFEKQFEQNKRTTVRAFIGNPTFKSLSEISSAKLQEEIDHVFDILGSNNINVDFLCDVLPEEVYRFLTEELLDEEMDDIRIEGMNHNYIYEEFHPNDEYDAKQWAEDFLSGIFWLETDLYSHQLADEGLIDPQNQPITKEQMLKDILDFRKSFLSFERPELNIISCSVDGDRATVTIHINWSGEIDERSSFNKSGTSTLRLIRSQYGGWDIVQAIVPGWNAE